MSCTLDSEYGNVIMRSNLNGVVLKVCLFHVGQAFFKNFCEFNLKAEYKADGALKKWFSQVFILALIPLESVDDYWINTIMPAMSQLSYKYTKIQGFTEYIINNYFEGSFPQKYWNHFLTF